jgi:hypothetical protein
VLYIVWVGADEPLELDELGPRFELAPQLHLIESELTQSRLYHLVKWALPPDTELLVAIVDGRPKFKGMAPGALAWLRSRSPGG